VAPEHTVIAPRIVTKRTTRGLTSVGADSVDHGINSRLHVCVEWMVPPPGSWAVMPGIAARLFVNGALVVTKCPVAPVSRIAGDFGGEEA